MFAVRSQRYNEKNPMPTQIRGLDLEIQKLYTALNGRLRFGDGADGERGENIAGEFQVFTSNAVANTEDTIAHLVGAIPIGYIVCGQDKAGSLYQLSGTGTAWTATNIYLKCSVASVQFRLFLIK